MADEYGNSTEIFEEENIRGDHDIFIRVLLEVYTLTSIVCVAANILIIFVIVKYKRLRREKWNIIILNWATVNCLYMSSSPITFRLIVDLWHLVTSTTTLCFVEQMEYSLLLIDILLIILLTLYWYIKLYHAQTYVKLNQHMKYVLIFVNALVIPCVGLNVDNCYNLKYFYLSELIVAFVYLLFVLFMTIINIIHAVRKRRLVEYSNRKNVPFILSNTLFLSYLPILLALFSPLFSIHASTYELLIAGCLLIAILNPFYFFIILYRCDRDTFFRHIFSCRCREYSDELVEQPVSYNNEIENTQ